MADAESDNKIDAITKVTTESKSQLDSAIAALEKSQSALGGKHEKAPIARGRRVIRVNSWRSYPMSAIALAGGVELAVVKEMLGKQPRSDVSLTGAPRIGQS